jgi:hypothetical protein
VSTALVVPLRSILKKKDNSLPVPSNKSVHFEYTFLNIHSIRIFVAGSPPNQYLEPEEAFRRIPGLQDLPKQGKIWQHEGELKEFRLPRDWQTAKMKEVVAKIASHMCHIGAASASAWRKVASII